ncbi:hypothetical protein N8920_00910 [Opitutales bacterium]|nr:hypothetical protein [Opitutales bacterium]
MYVVNNTNKIKSLWTWSCFIDEIINDEETIIIYGEDDLSKFNKNKLSIDSDEFSKDEKIICDEILFITLNDLVKYKKQISLFSCKSVIIPYNEITNESLSLCKDHGVNFIYTDILPDEITDTVDDVNYRYFAKNFIFVEPSIKNINGDEKIDLLVISCNSRENFNHIELIINSLSNSFKIKQLNLEEINSETVLPRYKTVLSTAVNPNVFHIFSSKNKNNCFLLNENCTYSPIRYFFYYDNTAPTEIQNHISFKSIRSFTQTIIRSLSSDYISYDQNSPIYTNCVRDKQQLINIRHKPQILDQAWRYRRTIDDLVKYPEVCFSNYSKRAFYLYNSIIKSNNNDNANLNILLKDLIMNFHISDIDRKFDRDFHDHFQKDSGDIDYFIKKTLDSGTKFSSLKKKDICKTVLGKISNLAIFQLMISNKKIVISSGLLDDLYQNSTRDITSSLYYTHISICLDSVKIPEFIINSHTQVCTLSSALLLISLGEYSKANDLLNIKSFTRSGFNKKCGLLIRLISFEQNVFLSESIHSLNNNFDLNEYSKDDFLDIPMLLFFLNAPYATNSKFFYFIYKYLLNASVLPENLIDSLFSMKACAEINNDFVLFLEDLISKLFQDLPSYENDGSMPNFMLELI